MVNDPSLPHEFRTMAVFVLSNIVRGYPQGQQAALQANSISTCLLALEEDLVGSPGGGGSSSPSSSSPAHDQIGTSSGITGSPSAFQTSSPSPSSSLHKWVCICLGLTWQEFPAARWCGVRDSAHEKVAEMLRDGDPEVMLVFFKYS